VSSQDYNDYRHKINARKVTTFFYKLLSSRSFLMLMEVVLAPPLNDADFYLYGFSRYIHDSSDILYAELYAIYQGFLLAKEKGIVDLISYSDSLLCINIIIGPLLKFHAYVVLIQDIKELMGAYSSNYLPHP